MAIKNQNYIVLFGVVVMNCVEGWTLVNTKIMY